MMRQTLDCGVVCLSIPASCSIQEYEAELQELFREGFPLRTLLENLSGQTRWSLDEVKAHLKRVATFAAVLTRDHAVAIVASQPLGFGQGRMAQGSLASVFPCRIEVFTHRQDALEWLLSEAPQH